MRIRRYRHPRIGWLWAAFMRPESRKPFAMGRDLLRLIKSLQQKEEARRSKPSLIKLKRKT